MFNIPAFIAHIEAHSAAQAALGNAAWNEIGLAADLAFLEPNNRLVAPSCWLVPGVEESRDASDMKLIRQTTTCNINVVTVVRNYRISDFNAEGLTELAAQRSKLKLHLIGYRDPQPEFQNTLRHSRGRLVRYTAELLVYLDEYYAEYRIQKFV